jgi:hypothetical protein
MPHMGKEEEMMSGMELGVWSTPVSLANCTLGLLELILSNGSEQTGQVSLDSLEAWKHTLHSAALWSS